MHLHFEGMSEHINRVVYASFDLCMLAIAIFLLKLDYSNLALIIKHDAFIQKIAQTLDTWKLGLRLLLHQSMCFSNRRCGVKARCEAFCREICSLKAHGVDQGAGLEMKVQCHLHFGEADYVY